MDFEKFFVSNEATMSPSSIFAAYKVSKIKNKRRKLDKFLKKAQVEVEDKTIGQASNISLSCQNTDQHNTPMNRLLDRRMAHKKGRI